ncbi:TPA: hypothetical protein QHX44_001576 [Klebsiella oxytoca]|nr:hypothetical protein [Klebsiella oxytoca]
MKYHIMSDNTYFIMGVSHAEEIRKSNVSIIKIPRDISRASPSPGDVFMLYIPEPGRTRKFIRRFSLHLLRMVILVDAPVFRQVKKHFPWVMSAAISLRELFSVIHLAEMAPARYRKVSGQAARIISLLTAGVSVRDAAEKLNWSGGRGNFTLNSSAVAPEDYQSLSAGVAWNSSAVRFLYVRHFDMTGTSLQIPGYQYRSKNFLEFPEFLYR